MKPDVVSDEEHADRNGTPPPPPAPEPDVDPEPELSAPPAPAAPPGLATAELEDRLRRIEEALAKIAAAPPPPAAPQAPVAHFVSAAPPGVPGTALLDAGRRLLQTSAGLTPSQLPVAHVPPEPAYVTGIRYSGMFVDALVEARVLMRLFVDPRHAMSWLSRLLPVALVALIFSMPWWGPNPATWLGFTLEKLLTLALAYALFKVLGHEIRRYMQSSPDLPPHLRL